MPLLRLVLAVMVLTGWSCQTAAQGPSVSAFPAPARPVAPVISPSYTDEATRDRHGEAERVMDLLGIQAGVRVADIGAGSGYYTVRVAKRLGPGGTLYAEDIKPDYLAELEARLRREAIANVTLVLGAPRDPTLPPTSIDVAILSHMYHEIENPYEFLYRLWPALARGSRVGVIDVDKPTQHHGTPLPLLRCELAAVGYRQLGVTWLSPPGLYLATFAPPDRLPPIAAITACPQ